MKYFKLLFCGAVAFAMLLTQTSTTLGQSKQVKVNKKEPYGSYLTDGQGMSLYLFLKDSTGASACYDKCAEAWPPMLMKNGDIQAGQSLQSNKLGTIKRDDGSTQVTYNDHPLYYYEDDKKAGDVEGQDKKEYGAEWYLVKPNGEKMGDVEEK